MSDPDLATHPDHSIRRDAWQVWWGTQPHPCGPDCRTHGQCDVAAAAQQRIEETMARHTHIICRTCGARSNVPQHYWSGALRWARSKGWDAGKGSSVPRLRCPACVRGPAIPAVVAPPERDMTDIDALIARRRARHLVATLWRDGIEHGRDWSSWWVTSTPVRVTLAAEREVAS